MSGTISFEDLCESELFRGLGEAEVGRFVEIARPRHLRAGQYLFLLGDHADLLYVVLGGEIELCFPLWLDGTLRDVAIESKVAGSTLGWSALVKPHRFTLSARASSSCRLASFPRLSLSALLDSSPAISSAFMRRIAAIVGLRLLRMQALWARELQRGLSATSWPERSGSERGRAP